MARIFHEKFPERPWQSVVIHLCVREGVAADLRSEDNHAVSVIAFERYVRRLHTQTGVSLSCAVWGVTCWSESLGKTAPAYVPRLLGVPMKIKTNPRMASRPTGAPWSLRGHRKKITSINFSPDGSLIATSSLDRTVRLWDARSADAVKCLMCGHRDWIRTVAFSPDGKSLASGGDDGSVRLWDPQSGERKYALQGHSDWVRDLAWSPDGRILASGGRDGRVVLWEAASLHQLAQLGPFSGGVTRIAFDPQGRWLAIGRPNAVEIWTLATARRAQLAKTSGNRPVLASGKRDRLYIGDDNGIRTWNVQRGDWDSPFEETPSPIRVLTCHPNGKALISAGPDRAVRLWDTRECYLAHTFQFQQVRISSLGFHPAGHIGIGFSDGNGQLREMTSPVKS